MMIRGVATRQYQKWIVNNFSFSSSPPLLITMPPLSPPRKQHLYSFYSIVKYHKSSSLLKRKQRQMKRLQKQRNRSEQQSKKVLPIIQKPPPSPQSTIYKIWSLYFPKLNGVSSYSANHSILDYSILRAVFQRLFVFASIGYIFTFSLSLDVMDGPSMIPTILPGKQELYIRDCITKTYQKNDVIIFVDNKGEYCCKRIVGMENDNVCPYGEYAWTLFANHDTLGIPQPISPIDSITRSKITVPKGHVWVEGDNPLYSIDSRQYGPIPLSNIKGRVWYRLWPRRHFQQPSCFMSTKRPQPSILQPNDILEDGQYNVYKFNKPQSS